MTITLKQLTTATAISAGLFSGYTASAQHDSPKSITGVYIQKKNMDETVPPGTNFFEFANGNWVKNNPIPAKETGWGSFNVLHDVDTKRMITILDDVNKPNQPKGSIKQRVGDLYASAMDSIAIDRRGYNPIKPDLQRVSQINTLADVTAETVYDRTHALSTPLYTIGVGADAKYPTKNIIQLNQNGGITLPDRDYYLKDDAHNKTIQAAYHTYLVSLFTLTGTPAAEAEANAKTVFEIEKKLAAIQLSRTEQRDPIKRYNKYSIAGYSKMTPHFNWVDICPKLQMGGQDSLIVGQPAYFKSLDSLMAVVPVKDWKTYLAWHVLKNASESLSTPFVKADFAFNKALSGQEAQAPRKERMATLVDGSVGELLGQIYVERYFSPEAKTYMANLINNLKIALGDRIKKLDWMSPETKVRALKKLSGFTVKIAYPDKWQTYDGLNINRDDYYGNVKRVAVWNYNYNVSQLGKPVDKTRWGMTPPTVNAYYSPVNNEIVFPAGILQVPFFDLQADDAMNYGGIGVVIGHEMTHGFDDSGRQYDYDGTLRDWWTKEDADKFKARADRVVAQYNAFTVVDTATHINGRLTLGENLADLGGLNIAYEAFKKTKEGQSNTKIDGFTPDQRFFLSYAQVWRGSRRDETARQRVLTDPHSPGLFRTNGPITNIDAWYTAFDIKPGNALYKKPEDRIKIW